MMENGILKTWDGQEVLPAFLKSLKQKLFYAPKQKKMELLTYVLRKRLKGKLIIFRRTTFGADKVVKMLAGMDCASVGIHSEKSDEENAVSLKSFKSGNIDVLVVTDTAFRRLDLNRVDMIINFDLPTFSEHYVDRQSIAVSKAVVITFCALEEKQMVRDIQQLIDLKLVVEKNHPFVLDPKEFAAEVRRTEGTGKKSRKSANSKKKKKRWY